MEFVFGLPKDAHDNTCVVVFVDRLSKMAHLAAVPDSIDGEDTARLFIDRVFCDQGLLYYCTDAVDPPLIVVPHDEDLKYRILYDVHDTAIGGHFGRELNLWLGMPGLLVAQTV